MRFYFMLINNFDNSFNSITPTFNPFLAIKILLNSQENSDKGTSTPSHLTTNVNLPPVLGCNSFGCAKSKGNI